MKTVKNFTVTISKKEREKVTDALDVLDTFFAQIGLDIDNISAEKKYDILDSIEFQCEEICVNSIEIALKYEY